MARSPLDGAFILMALVLLAYGRPAASAAAAAAAKGSTVFFSPATNTLLVSSSAAHVDGVLVCFEIFPACCRPARLMMLDDSGERPPRSLGVPSLTRCAILRQIKSPSGATKAKVQLAWTKRQAPGIRLTSGPAVEMRRTFVLPGTASGQLAFNPANVNSPPDADISNDLPQVSLWVPFLLPPGSMVGLGACLCLTAFKGRQSIRLL